MTQTKFASLLQMRVGVCRILIASRRLSRIAIRRARAYYGGMIASRKPHSSGYTHTLSEAFLAAIEKAMRMIRSKEPGWKSIVMDMLLQEFPSDPEMRAFAEDCFSEIVGLLLKGERAIYIHRSLSHGLELFTDD